ncbi:MAG TPA: hypothetical protein PLM75_08855, partial [bacterium]|nr:hypothetical protein [bacterium]
GHYPVFSDTSEYVLSDVGIDSTGNIMIIRYDYYDTNIKIYALPSNSGNVVLLCETSSVYFQNPTIVSDKNQNLKLFFYSSSSSRLFQYALSYNPRNLTQNSGALMYLNSPDLNESLGTYKINYDSNNRLHLTYYKSGYGYYWIYSDNLGDTFSSTKLLYNDYSGGYNNDNFGGLGNGAMFILKHNDPAAVSSLQFSKTTIFSDNPETTVFLTNAGDTKYNSYFSDFVAGCTGVYTFFDLQNITDTKLAVVVFRNFGDTWSSPINIFDTIPINYQSLYASANDRAAKYIAIKNQVSSGGHYYGGITITEAYLLEVFGAYAFHSAASRIIGGSQAPVITPDNIMPVYRGEPQTITCLVEDNDDTAPTVRLWYRGDSLGSFSSVLMQQDIDYQTSYHYTIPGSFTEGTSKIYYYFSAIDKYNNATFVDSSGVYSSAPYIPVPLY